MPPKMYYDVADWFHLITAPADYAEEAETYSRLLIDASERPPQTVLELGSGGGNNASHMKSRFTLTLTDISPAMLELSKTINPECEHIEGDMRTLRLGREFDAVFVHDAVGYMTAETDLRAAIETAFVHCRPGGAALFAPDVTHETFRASTSHGGHDGDNGRSARYLEWTPEIADGATTYTTDYAYLLREAGGSMHVERDSHTLGVFPRETWLSLLRDVGFEANVVPFEHSALEPGAVDLFVCKKAG